MFKCNWFKTISCIRISNSEQFCDGSQQVFGTEVLTVMMVMMMVKMVVVGTGVTTTKVFLKAIMHNHDHGDQ